MAVLKETTQKQLRYIAIYKLQVYLVMSYYIHVIKTTKNNYIKHQ